MPGVTEGIHPGDHHQHGEMTEPRTVIEIPRQAGSAMVHTRSYDYAIVGAGSAGCVVARRLLDGTDARA